MTSHSQTLPKILYGEKWIEEVLDEIVGDQVLICSSKSVIIKEEISQLISELKYQKMLILDEISPNPTDKEIDHFAGVVRNFKPTTILAIGGGSVIDVAKVLGVLLSSPTPILIHDFLLSGMLMARKNKLIAIPTTCGTGSEATPFATIWTKNGTGKMSIESSVLRPEVCVLVGSLSSSAPLSQIFFSGLDAMSHCIETLWNRNLDAQSEKFAHDALTTILRIFPNIVNGYGTQIEWQEMQEAAMFAGCAISKNHTAIAHSISYPLTAYLGVPHGLACSFSIPAIWKNLSVETRLLTGNEKLISEAVEMIESMGVMSHLKQYTEISQLVALVPEMLKSNRAGNFIVNYTEDELNELLGQM